MDNASTKVLMARINKYNEQVKQIDQQKPIALLLFILYNGYLIFFYESDEWFIDKGFDFPELKLLEFANEAEAEIAKEREKDTIVFDKTKEEIRKKLLYDKEFHGCTNSYMRTQYVERHYDLEMRRMFREHGDHLVSFVESIWKEYKSNRLLYCKPQNE